MVQLQQQRTLQQWFLFRLLWNSSVGTNSGSFTYKGSGSTTGGSSGTGPGPLSFQGAAVTFSSGLVVSLAAPGIVACALI